LKSIFFSPFLQNVKLLTNYINKAGFSCQAYFYKMWMIHDEGRKQKESNIKLLQDRQGFDIITSKFHIQSNIGSIIDF